MNNSIFGRAALAVLLSCGVAAGAAADPVPPTSLSIIGFTGGPVPGVSLRSPRDIQAQNGYAYLTDSINNGILVANLSNPAAPAVVTVSAGNCAGANKEALDGNYLFAACQSENDIKIFDISSPTAPNLVTTLNGPDPGNTLNGVREVYVNGKYLYALSRRSVAMSIFDISDPASPQFVSQTPLAGSAANQPLQVTVRGSDAYVLTNNGLYIYDVSNPAVPALRGHTQGLVPGISLEQARAIQLVGNYALIAVNQQQAVATIDISNPDNPVYLGSFSGPDPGQSFRGITDIWVSGSNAYTADDIADTVSILDIADPTDISWIDAIPRSTDYLQGVQQFASDGDYLYYIAQDNTFGTAGMGVIAGNGAFDIPFDSSVSVSEPMTLALFAAGLLACGVAARRRRPAPV
jgi:hypothetical protein